MDSYIKNIKSKFDEAFSQNAKVILVFGVFFFFLIMQHHFVGMYFDDFGNSSLSYGYDSSNISGTDYGIKDLLEWAVFIYHNWGGRIIYALMLIPLQKNGPHLFMAIQAVIIILTYIVALKLLKLYYKETNDVIAAIVFVVGYGILKGDTLSNGYYWASASVLYVWPLLPFLSSIYFYERLVNKIKSGSKISFKDWWMFIVLFPLAVLSQEQLGGGFFVWALFRAGIDFFAGSKWKGNIVIVVSSFALLAMMILAPGNFARMESNTEYFEMSFWDKIVNSFNMLMELLNHSDMLWFNVVLTIFGLGMMMLLYNKMNKVAWILEIVLIIPCLLEKAGELLLNVHISTEMKNLLFFVFQVVLCIGIVEFFVIFKMAEFIPIMMAAISSVYCLLIAPTFSLRQCIPYVFLSVIFINLLFQMFINKTTLMKIPFIWVMLLFLLIGTLNMISTYRKYERNYYADSLNRSILRNYDGNSDTIYLLEYDNEAGRGMMSCDEGFEFTDIWMKEYYDIPQDVEIVWKDISECLSE
ncbi:DUF6056 family protein [Butyrivibrio sp. WCE2006]|uniref:DUF6056 family protein n=1 Tax=Butyrivibrio sp. WCE2006 TaxID=1410611 RepID=UPI0005D2433A|nr:DUF6056 family protein [Butyrivibrio sp. WCE2006]